VAAPYVAVLVVDLHFPEAGSLKDRRRELAPVKTQLQGRMGCAVAELGEADRWQRATLGVALVAGSPRRLADRADTVQRWLDDRFPQGVSVERVVASVDDLRP
jgi:uncharacterized protein